MATTTVQAFARILSMEEFLDLKGIQSNQIQIVQTTVGKQFLTAQGSIITTIQNDLKGETLAATKAKLAGVNLCFGMPHPGSTDTSGRPSLPCAMISKSEWESVALF